MSCVGTEVGADVGANGSRVTEMTEAYPSMQSVTVLRVSMFGKTSELVSRVVRLCSYLNQAKPDTRERF